MLIGLTARNAAGKDEVARLLVRRHGFRCFSLSDVLRAELGRRGLPVTRENLIEVGTALRREQGEGVLAEAALRELEGVAHAVVVSIRHPAEVEALRRREDFLLVGVDAPVELRWQRASRRGRSDDASSLEEFVRQEQREAAGCGPEQQLEACFSLSDRVIVNDRSLEELQARVRELL